MTPPTPITIRRRLLAQHAHAWPLCLPGAAKPTPAQLTQAARRWAALDRKRGVRIVVG